MRTIAFLGPRGTFTEGAAKRFFPVGDVTFVPYASIAQVLEAVQAGVADHAVVPLENSIEGSVTMTMDWLIHHVDLKLQAELTMPITQHFFTATAKELQEIRTIYSHPQAISQCRAFLHTHLPHAQVEYTASTADAVQRVTSAPEQPWAAIGPLEAGHWYGAHRLQGNIQDHENNSTRFVLVGSTKQLMLPVSPDTTYKTTLVVELPADFPGALHQVLAAFAWRRLNLTKIESRPTKRRLGSYHFILDVEREGEDVLLAGAIAEIKALGCEVHIFGSYPVCHDHEKQTSTEQGAVHMMECKSIAEARACIDRIDDQIVRLLAERSEYVGEAMKFKKVAQDANVPSRNEEIFQRVRTLASAYALDPNIAESVYRAMIQEFVRFQTRALAKQEVDPKGTSPIA